MESKTGITHDKIYRRQMFEFKLVVTQIRTINFIHNNNFIKKKKTNIAF